MRFFVALLLAAALITPVHVMAAEDSAEPLKLPELPDLPEDGSDALNLPDLSKVPEKPSDAVVAPTPTPEPVATPEPTTPALPAIPALPEPAKETAPAPAATPALPTLPSPTAEESTTKIDLPTPTPPAAPEVKEPEVTEPEAKEPAKKEEAPAKEDEVKAPSEPEVPALPTLSKDAPFSTTIESLTPSVKKIEKKDVKTPKKEEETKADETSAEPAKKEKKITRPAAQEGESKTNVVVPLDIPALENPLLPGQKSVQDYGIPDAPNGECALFANHFAACDNFYCKTDHPTQKQALLLEQKIIGKLDKACYFVQKKYEKSIQGCKATLPEGKSPEVTCSNELLDQLNQTLIPQIEEARKKEAEENLARITQAGGATLAEQAADGTVSTKAGDAKPFERKLSGNGVRPTLNYDTATLPENIYRQPHTGDNRDMPAAYTNNQFVAMTFTAVQRFDNEGLRALLPKIRSLGYSIDVQNPQGNTLLIQAVLAGNVNAMQMLLSQGAKPDMQNKEGLTALHIAAYGGRIDMVNILLQSGASTYIRDNYNRTARDLASQSNNAGIAQLLNR